MAEDKAPENKSLVQNVITKPEIAFLMSLVMPVAGLAVAWGVITTKVEHVEDTAVELRAEYEQHVEVASDRNDKIDTTLLQIQVHLAEISTRQVEIQKDIMDIKQELKDGSRGGD